MSKSKKKHGGKKRGKRHLKKRSIKKLFVKKQFKSAMTQLRRMSPAKQKAAMVGASDKFIKDISQFVKRIRKKPHLVKPSHQKLLKRYKHKLRSLVHAKTPVNKKRLILYQHVGGQLIAVLVPIICAIVGAGGTIGGSAVAAKIMKN